MKAIKFNDGITRCSWCSSAPEFIRYHDEEWGYPVTDDYKLFEKISLESFQAGLSWRTILQKRDNFRHAFVNFDFNQIALFSQSDIDRLLNDKGIIRHRGKIESVINNARQSILLVNEFGSLSSYFWAFEPQGDEIPEPQSVTTTASATRLSKDLKKRGWKFVGPTTVFSFMQAMGLINDHAIGCESRDKVANAKADLKQTMKSI